ncbi:MAG: hypothetical protein ACOC56_04705 [Atribacterota bacterium]
MKKYAVSKLMEIQERAGREYAKIIDRRIYRIISGEFKLRKDGELDRRFKENRGKI